MNGPTSLRTRLLLAELAYAHFNAHRTSAGSCDVIVRSRSGSFEVLLDASRPTSPYYNRAVPSSTDDLRDQSLRELPPAVMGVEVERAHGACAETRATLARFGFAPAYSLCYLSTTTREPVAPQMVPALVPGEVDAFFDMLVQEGVPFPADKRVAKRGFYCTDQFQAFAVRDASGTAIGWSTMFVSGANAFFGNSFVLPAHRGKGTHAALLAARLSAAHACGVDMVFTDVEPDTGSLRNCLRAGFQVCTETTVWKRLPPGVVTAST